MSLVVVAAECMTDLTIIGELKGTTPEAEFRMLPRVRTVALDAAIGSGLFNAPSDRMFFTRLCRLSEILTSLNRAIDTTERQMMAHPDRVQEWNRKMVEGKMLAQMADEQIGFMQYLISDCGIKESDEFYDAINESGEIAPARQTASAN